MWKFKCPNLMMVNNDIDPMTRGDLEIRCKTYEGKREKLPLIYLSSLSKGDFVLEGKFDINAFAMSLEVE